MHSLSTFGARTNHGQPQIHKTNHGSDLREAITFSLIVYYVLLHEATSKWHFVSKLPNGNPEIPRVGTFATLRPHNFVCRLLIEMRSKAKLQLSLRAFNNMLHATCMQGNWVDFKLLMGSQIANLTPDPSFGHNLCFRCSNGSCEPILDIYVPRDS